MSAPRPKRGRETITVALSRREADQLIEYVGPRDGVIDLEVATRIRRKLLDAAGYRATPCAACGFERVPKGRPEDACPACSAPVRPASRKKKGRRAT